MKARLGIGEANLFEEVETWVLLMLKSLRFHRKNASDLQRWGDRFVDTLLTQPGTLSLLQPPGAQSSG